MPVEGEILAVLPSDTFLTECGAALFSVSSEIPYASEAVWKLKRIGYNEVIRLGMSGN
jgi:hypothetical protein